VDTQYENGRTTSITDEELEIVSEMILAEWKCETT